MYKIEDFEKKKKRSINVLKIFNICICLIIIPIIIYNLTLIVKYIINPEETPDFLGYKTYEIVSRSMENTINKNDVIVVKDVPKTEIKSDDIIAFNNGEEVITHRVIDIENIDGKTFYTTKGDNNRYPDKNKITYEQIEGKYVFKINKFGYFLNILKNRYLLSILFVILVLCLVHIVMIKRRKKKREEKMKIRL